jgi:7,8-dihydropterin-6-yl-methyl-4-(beta-D-ribofuranosyl)aminobenzene 5'-phosphate synthase
VVIFHFHGDHTGGLGAFLAVNTGVVIYCPAVVSGRFRESILQAGAKVAEVPFISQIQPGVWLVPGDAGSFEELALVLETDRGLVVVTGCAHPGLETFVREIRDFSSDHILLLMGGFHLEARSNVEIKAITDMLKNNGLVFCAPCHCSGKTAKTMFRKVFEGYLETGAGARIELKDLEIDR